MRDLVILVKMQLKERLNFKRTELKDINLFRVLVSVLGVVLKFAVMVVLCNTVLSLVKSLNVFSLTHYVPDSVMSLLFAIMLLTSVVSCTVGLTKSLYFSRDNAILLTLPCQPIHVYLSKLIIFFIFEVKRNCSFIVPLFIAYFYTHGYPIGAYPWMLFCIVLVSLFTVAVGALLSIPAMWIGNLFRQSKLLQIATLLAVVSGATVALFFGISLIPADIDLIAKWGTTYWEIQDFLTAYTTKFSGVYQSTGVLLGQTHNLVATFPIGATLMRFAQVLSLTTVLLVLGFLVVRPLFYKMASKPFEHMKKKVRPKKNHKLPRAISAVWVEVLVAIKGAARLFASVGVLIALPMLVYLLNKIFLAMNTREMGNYMTVAFNVLIILLIALNANCSVASLYSRDGRSAYLIKTQPSRYWPLLLAKLIPNLVFMLLAFVATFFILLNTSPLGTGIICMLAGSLFATYLAHLFYCAELDLMNPQIELYATVGNTESNPNESRATLTAFLLAFGIALLMLLLMLESATATNVFVKYLAISLVALGYRLYMFFSKIKLYYKEK